LRIAGSDERLVVDRADALARAGILAVVDVDDEGLCLRRRERASTVEENSRSVKRT